MGTGTKMVVGTIVVGGLGASAFAVGYGPRAAAMRRWTPSLWRGVRLWTRALAVGRIEPLVEVSVKSQLAGVVRRMFKEPGEYVRQGEPLLEVQPNPTPIELVEARRNIELREIEVAATREASRSAGCVARPGTRIGRGARGRRILRSARSRSSSRSPGSAWLCSRKAA